MSKLTVEETYKKQTQHEHILSRPDTYIGAIDLETEPIWILDPDSRNTRFIQRELTYSPALYRITDELINNAQDNKVRDPSMSEFRLDIDPVNGVISVFNNGKSIPIEIHKEYNIYVAELIFGNLLTSSNYDDSEKRVTGGRNGYGAKLTNIFSTEFIIETRDSSKGKAYRQVFTNNMFNTHKPEITKSSGPSYTKVTFKPDLKRFKMTHLDNDIVSLLERRVYDVAGTAGSGLKVFLNGKRITVKNFKDYCNLYFTPPLLTEPNSDDEDESTKKKKGKSKQFVLDNDGIPCTRIHAKINDRWEVMIAASDNGFQQASFVNGINTLKGGTHVNAIADQVSKAIIEHLGKGKNKVTVKPVQVKNHLWVMVNSLIENPSFDTQTKVTLTTKRSAFGSDPSLPEACIKAITASPIAQAVLDFAHYKQNKDMKKTDGKKKVGRVVGIPKLEDANEAGGRKSKDCTLILTEGDSAKALAMAGLSVVGRDLFGVFPLRGKVLNAREATPTQISDNKEITYLKQILGLRSNVKYEDTSSLRYGHIMIMTDQDHDGSHIKGLIINLFDALWPGLLKIPGFITEFVTPIVKVSRNGKSIPFYTLPEYEAWREEHNNGKGWTIKYYKGLGTSTSAEAKVYFANIDSHQVPFEYEGPTDHSKIEMAFARNKVEDRKTWISEYVPGTFLDHSQSSITYTDFINKELVLFCIAANQRGIPSLVDGLKPGQRKVLFSSFKRNLTKEIKVAQLAGYVSEQSAYHHGEVSLASTIINLAQDYVGANNLNILIPSGQFGTRAQGGKDAASARYIFTYLNPLTRKLFHKDDDNLLSYLNDDGLSIEPEYYCPVIPTALINGSSGIGMGWSSDIPNYNPRDLIANIRNMIHGNELIPMHPFYKGYIGQTVIRGNSGSYLFRGMIEQIDDDTIHIYELPIGVWTSDYKEFLETLVTSGQVTAIAEYHTDVSVSFGVSVTPACMEAANKVGLHKFFKLEKSLSTTNMVLFDKNGKLKKYDSPLDILRDFFFIRKDMYVKRKNYMCQVLKDEVEKLDSKVRFILGVVEDTIKIRNVKKTIIVSTLKKMGFKQILPKKEAVAVGAIVEEDDGDEESESEDDGGKDSQNGYNYLLSMPLWSLTYEKVQQLRKEKKTKEDQLDVLSNTSIETLWETDLTSLEDALDEYEQDEINAANGIANNAKYKKGKKAMSKTDDSDDDDWGASKKKKTTKRASAKEKKKIVPDWVLAHKTTSFQQTLVEEEEEVKKKRVTKKAAPASTLSLDADTMLSLLDADDPFAMMTKDSTLPDDEGSTLVEAKTKKTTAKPKAKAALKSKTAPKRTASKSKTDDWDSEASDGEMTDDLADFGSDTEFFDSDDDVIQVKPKRAASKKTIIDSDSEDDYGSKPKRTTSTTVKKTASKTASKVVPKKTVIDLDDYDSNSNSITSLPKPTVKPSLPEEPVDISTLSLKERLALKMAKIGTPSPATGFRSPGGTIYDKFKSRTSTISSPFQTNFNQILLADNDDHDDSGEFKQVKKTISMVNLSDDDEPPVKKTTKTTKTAAAKTTKTAAKKRSIDEDLEDSPQPKRARKKIVVDSDSEAYEAPKPKTTAKRAPAKKKTVDSDDDMFDEPKPKAKRAPAKKKVVNSDDEDVPAPVKKTSSTVSRKKTVVDSSDDEFGAGLDDDDDMVYSQGSRSRSRRTATTQKKYTFDDDSDDEYYD